MTRAAAPACRRGKVAHASQYLVLAAALLAALWPVAASATPPPATSSAPAARFALIIGVNKSVDPEAAPLRYADDDAASYLDLFRSLGARSYVLARLDENTQRIHPQAAAEAVPPTRIEFSRALDRLASDLAQAHERGVPTVLYFVYAGHGTVKNERGYISLEDARLGAVDLETEVVDKLHADQTHFIVDACYSYFLVTGRGPGGSRREVHGFSQLGGLATRPGVGLLLSTSSARESHEWAAFQGGVFSHEVRSGLYGAADADGDGQVTYREMVAFIERANVAVANERYRPDVFA
ncbi:MAG TPA: caspase family protein, partial [Polyangiaceae bacterium]